MINPIDGLENAATSVEKAIEKLCAERLEVLELAKFWKNAYEELAVRVDKLIDKINETQVFRDDK